MQALAQFFGQGQFGTLETGVLVVLSLWSIIWKGIALWKSARNKQLYWFIAIFILSTLGLLEIIYILFFQKEEKENS